MNSIDLLHVPVSDLNVPQSNFRRIVIGWRYLGDDQNGDAVYMKDFDFEHN